MPDLAGLFDPERVAVIGATDRPGSVGRALMENLLADFDGEVVPVNPNRETVLGRACLGHVGDAAEPIDLAVVAVPAGAALGVIREAAEAGVRNVVVVTAGFGEAGGEGAAREADLAALAAEFDLDLVGPNCVGVISTPVGLNATFAPQNALAGDVSFMSQSGAFVTAVLDWAADHDVGFKDIVSLGNEVVLDEVDFIEFWGDDPDTAVILGYLEDIDDGREFIEATRAVTPETPVVVIKSGRTPAGAEAASSHTGAMAGSERAYEAGLAQAGAIRADDVEELFDFAQVLSGQPPLESDEVAIVTNAGGPGVMATDAVGASRLRLSSFTEDTRRALHEVLPAASNAQNPIDVIGDADLERFRAAIEVVLDDPTVAGAVVVSCPTALLDYDELARTIGELSAEHETPVVACLMGGERAVRAGRLLDDAGIPNYFDPARAVRSLEVLSTYREIAAREYVAPREFDVDRGRARAVLERAADREGNRLGVEAMDLLEAYGIPVPRGEVVADPHEAARAAGVIGGPVVMKIVSPDIVHKTDVGGVRVGVPVEEVPAVFDELLGVARDHSPDADVLGVQVQELVEYDDGVETIVGLNRDAQFGPLVMFGLGGVLVQVLEDTTVRVAPISEAEARAMVEGIDAAALFEGVRGRPPVDVDAVVEVVQRFSQLVTDFPAIQELDVNPLVARPDDCVAIDLRLTVDPERL